VAEQRALRVAVGVGRPDADDIRVLRVVSITLHNAITDPNPQDRRSRRLGFDVIGRADKQTSLPI